MPKKILIVILVVVLLCGVFFVYQWWQIKKEMAKQTEKKQGLIEQLSEAEKKIRESIFQQCSKVALGREQRMAISLTGLSAGRKSLDLRAIDPEGREVNSGTAAVPSMYYIAGPEEEENEIFIGIDIMEVKVGNYLIIIEPGEDIFSTDSYTLELYTPEVEDLVIAENIPYSENLLDRLYIFRSTEDGVIPFVPTSVGCGY